MTGAIAQKKTLCIKLFYYFLYLTVEGHKMVIGERCPEIQPDQLTWLKV
jgi:hypothetical protein